MPEQKSAWKLCKTHAMYHYRKDIVRGGVAINYSAEMWESLHKTVMKSPWKGSNKRNVDGQIMRHNAQRDMLFGLKTYIEEETKQSKTTNWDEVGNPKPFLIYYLFLLGVSLSGAKDRFCWGFSEQFLFFHCSIF